MIESPLQTGATVQPSPYKGLMSYSEDDAEFFFGRERERQIITANLLASRLTVLYGPSGVGKTSVLAAGVVHHLRQTTRRNVDLGGSPEFVVVGFNSWRDDPIMGLGDAIQSSIEKVMPLPTGDSPPSEAGFVELLKFWTDRIDADLLFVLDQFEEFFLYHESEDGPDTFAEEFPRALNRSDLRASWLVSIREDSLARLDRFKGRIPRLFENYLRIEHLDREAGRVAIEKPIEHFNRRNGSQIDRVAIEPALIDLVLDQVERDQVAFGEQGAGTVTSGTPDRRIETPYLQLVMSRIWEEERALGSSVLRKSTLERLEGAERIVRTHLDAAMNDFPRKEREVAAGAFRYLVTPGGTKIALAASDLADFAGVPEPQLTPVLEHLGSADVRILRAVSPAGGRTAPRYEIFHDVLAAAILDWRARFEQGREQADRERLLEEQKEEAEERARAAAAKARRTKLLAGAGVVVVIVLAAVTILALVALEGRRTARSLELAARADALLDIDPHQSVARALEAVQAKETLQSIDALRRALAADRVERVLRGVTGSVYDVAVRNGGSTVMAVDEAGFHTWDAATGRPGPAVEERDGAVSAGAISANGSRAVTGGRDGTVTIWDGVDGEVLYEQRGHETPVLAAAISPDGTLALTGGEDGSVLVWDTAIGGPTDRLAPSRLDGHDYAIGSAAFSPVADDRRVVTTSLNEATVWDLSGGEPVTFELHSDFVAWGLASAFSPDGRYVAIGEDYGNVSLWDAARGIKRSDFCCQVRRVTSVLFRPDGKELLVASDGDSTARIYDVSLGYATSFLPGHGSGVFDTAFNPDGTLVATTGGDGIVRVWVARSGAQVLALGGHRDIAWRAAFNPSGSEILSASEDGTVRIWDVGLGTTLELPERAADAAFNAAGTRMVTADHGGSARIWYPSGIQQARLPHAFILYGSAFSPSDEGSVAVWGENAAVHFWDTSELRGRATEAESTCCERQGWFVRHASFSPDGERLLITYADFTARIWDITQEPPAQMPGLRFGAPDQRADQVLTAEFSPDGQLIAAAGRDGSVQIYDADGGALVQDITAHRGIVWEVAFDADSRLVASASQDATARVHDARTGELVRVLQGSTSAVTSVAFGPGNMVLGGTADGSTLVWDLDSDSQAPMSFLRVHGGFINSATFGPDRQILTASDDFTARLYECDFCAEAEELEQLAKERLGLGG